MRLPICDRSYRLLARAFIALAGKAAGCSCCSFWRGGLIFGSLGALAGAALVLARF